MGCNLVTVPPGKHAIDQCPICRAVFDIQTNDDPLNRAYGSIHHMAIKCKDLISKASANTISHNNIAYSGSVTSSAFGYHPKIASRISQSLVPGSAHVNKRAVLCKVSYYGQRHRLNGTVNDANYHQTEGKILDDEINATIVRPLPRGAKLHAIIDACHSGTILDLPFVCRMNRDGFYMWEDQGRRSPIRKGTSGGLAVSFSACDDHDVSLDTTALSGDAPTGAMTYSFIQAAQNEPRLTYGRLLNAMRHKIRETTTGFLPNSPVTSLLKKVLKKPPQEPQLSSSNKFEVYGTEFCL